jgi:membrane fusion protein, copper/silver efflux system
MKKILSAVVIGLLMIFSYIAGWHHKARVATATANERRVLYWVDPMHPDYKSDHPGVAPDCGMQLEPVYAEPAAAAITYAEPLPPGAIGLDLEKQQLFGIRVVAAEKTTGREQLRVLGRVASEDTRTYRVTAGSDGFVRETHSDSVGELVKKDQKLATSYMGETLSIASGFLSAIAGTAGAGKDGNRTVPYPGAVSKQGFSSLQGYTDRLRNLGVSDAQIKEMAESRQLPQTIDIVSPADGFIVARSISPGQHFDRSMELYRIADLSKVWIVADIFDSEVHNIRPGDLARVTLSGQGKAFTARVSNVLPEVDPATRTLKLRLEAENPGYALRPDMFVDVELPLAMPAGLTVPLDAVIDSGREQRVFVERSGGVFEPRQVRTGWRVGDRVEIVRGLAEGERVVSAGTFLVDSESRLKSPAEAGSKHEAHELETAAAKAHADPAPAMAGKVKDPACGMEIDRAKAVREGNTLTRDGVTYYFCSDRCKKKFRAQPEHYVASNPSGHQS